jgi:homocysteine S-methyltransferase
MKDFWEKVKDKALVADGAMGTMLYNRGIPKGHCYDELNLTLPNIIKEIHKEYIIAGAEIIETNTFGANEYILSKYYDLGKKTEIINIKGAQIARESAQEIGKEDEIFVAGAVGPITRPLETTERLSLSQIYSLFKSQITALVEGGVDLIILETMVSLDELICGFKAAKDVCNLPIICQLSFTADGRTILGVDPVESAIKLDKIGVKIMGANCGVGPQNIYESVRRMGHVSNALITAQPNAGQPTFSRERFIYPATPQYFAEYTKKYLDIGVSIIGGCCGTTPSHIAAIQSIVEHKQPRVRKVVQVQTPIKKESPSLTKKIETTLQAKLRQKFVLTMEIDPPRGTDVKREIEAAQRFKQLGGDCINVSDNPMARLRMSPLPLAHLIKQETGLEIILHFTCRDRNLLAIQSDLIGAYALNIQNILALTGDPPSVGDYPFAVAVFEIRSEGLIGIMNSLNQGTDWLGNPIPQPTSFFVGIGSTLKDTERTKEKIKIGAKFIQTQPVFDIEEFRSFVSQIKETKVPVIAGIMVLASLQHAQFIQNEVPGISIPDTIMQRMAKGRKDEGIIIAKELLQETKNVSQGACIMLPFGKYELIEKIISL